MSYYIAAVKENKPGVMQLLRCTLLMLGARPCDRTTVLTWDDDTANAILTNGLNLPTGSVLIQIEHSSTATGLDEPEMKMLAAEEGHALKDALEGVGYVG